VLPSGDGIYTAYPAQSTILGAGKLTGRIGRFSVGVMHAVTQEERGTVFDGAVRSQQAIEPTTNYTVARARREFANQSSIGVMMTATGRRLPAALRCVPDRAYGGGLDLSTRGSSRDTASPAIGRRRASTAIPSRSTICSRTAATTSSGRTPRRSRSIRPGPP